MKRNKKGKFKKNILNKIADFIIKLSKKVLKTIVALLIGTIFGIYTLLERFYIVSSVFISKLPKVIKIVLFYTIIGAISILLLFPKETNKYINFMNIVEEEKVVYVNINEEVCKLDEISCKIYFVGQAYGFTREQSLIAVAIARHETDNFKSDVFKNKNNVGGIYKNEILVTYVSVEESINDFIKILKDVYFDKGLNTIDKIQEKYCPVGAKNDSTNQNVNWLPKVTKIYESLVK